MNHAQDATGNRIEAGDTIGVRWRPWPCEGCCGGSTPLGFLERCLGSSPEVPKVSRNEEIDRSKKWEADRLLEWIGCCEHTLWSDMCLPLLAQGSEHLVLFDEGTSEVVKITLPGTYGTITRSSMDGSTSSTALPQSICGACSGGRNSFPRLPSQLASRIPARSFRDKGSSKGIRTRLKKKSIDFFPMRERWR